LVEYLSRSKVSWKTWATTEEEEAGESKDSSLRTLSLRDSTSDLRKLLSALSSARREDRFTMSVLSSLNWLSCFVD